MSYSLTVHKWIIIIKVFFKQENNSQILEQLKDDLGLKNKPVHIECFDNSNIQGANPVAACVVFKNGKASKVGQNQQPNYWIELPLTLQFSVTS